MRADSFFLPAPGGRRYCIHHPPRAPLRGCILYVHPFAEEMNKSRRMAAEAARAFAARGWAVLQIDLQGCGDSSGDFGEATLREWLNDIRLGAQWLRERHGRVDVVWGLRLGALLACTAAAEMESVDLLLWQPVTSGLQHMTQFLRLRAAAEMLDANAERGGTKSLRESLQRGESIEVAGYFLAPELVLPIDQLKLQLPAGYSGRVLHLEIGSDAALSPAGAGFQQTCVEAGVKTSVRVVSGSAFWQSTEIEEVPALIAASVEVLDAKP